MNCAATRPTRNSSRDFGKDIIPNIVANGKAVAHRFSQACVRSSFETKSLLARCRHHRRLLGGQYRPDRHVTPNSISMTATGRSGPMPRSSRRQNSCMMRTAGAARRVLAGVGRLHHFGLALKRSLLFTGVRANSYSTLEEAVVLPNCTIGRNAS
jgi:glucose-1-phosphate adenylyltransferase